MIDDSTRVLMPAGDLGDALRTQMGGTMVCPVCQATTPVMETYCGDCGYLLTSAPPETLEVPVEEAPAAELVEAVSGRRHRLHLGVNTVGRQGTDVLVNEGTVSRVHARITLDGDTILVEDLGSTNGTKVGDQRIGPNQPMPAVPGTPLKFGSWQVAIEAGLATPFTGSGDATIALSGAEPAEGVADKTMVGVPGESEAPVPSADLMEPGAPADANAGVTPVAWLRRTEGPGADIALPVGTVTIGRRPGNTIVITSDAYISGRHAELVTDDTGAYLTDLGSTNGTQVNGRKLMSGERQTLLEGDAVQLGQTRYLFEPIPFEPIATEPAAYAFAGDIVPDREPRADE